MTASIEEVAGPDATNKSRKKSKSPHRVVNSIDQSPPRDARTISHAFTSPAHSRGASVRTFNTINETMHTPRGAKSDPIGKEEDYSSGGDLSSGGPLDDDLDDINVLSLSLIDTAVYSSRPVRSHTTQGIPSQAPHPILTNSTHVPKGSAEQEYFYEKDSLSAELEAYKNLAQHLEEQVMTLTMLLDEERRKVNHLAHSATNLGLPVDPSWFSPPMNQLNRVDGMPDTPSSTGVPSMTMSPDPFSPFLPFTPNTSYPGTPASTSHGQSCVYSAEQIRGGAMQASVVQLAPKDAEQHSYLNGLRFDVGGQELAPASSQSQEDENATEAPFGAIETAPAYSHQVHMSLQRMPTFPDASFLAEMPLRNPAYFCGVENYYDRNTCQDPADDSFVATDVLIARVLGTRSQEPSILLQQQLKSASPVRKASIVRGITPHLLQLAEDKHGNFLVQRAVGVDSNVGWRLRGNFVKLALKQYGCHVVLKVLETDEAVSKKVVEEMLSSQVEETLTSRNAVHIWQKILEIQWTDSSTRSRIFRVINETMRGKWANTAMLETGSIICQNIFESAEASEQHECLSEILERLCECASNQWGVWVVQHIIEHSESDVQVTALKELLSDAVSLTLSQYGQKAIMSALKTQNIDFITSYVNLLCDRDTTMASGRKDTVISSSTTTRRTNLVDVAIVPQGVLVVTQLLTSVTPELRARIINTVRRNSVFLKSTKSGLNVHRLCERARAYSGY